MKKGESSSKELGFFCEKRVYKNDNRDNIPLAFGKIVQRSRSFERREIRTSSSGKEYYYQQLKQLYLTTCFASNNTARVQRIILLTTIETTFRGEGGDKAMGHWRRRGGDALKMSYFRVLVGLK